MDAYLGYNQIRMHPTDEDKTTFIVDQAKYCYKVMPVGLKNAGVTYQRLMDKVLASQLGRNVEAYMDDMVVKSVLQKPDLARRMMKWSIELFDTREILWILSVDDASNLGGSEAEIVLEGPRGMILAKEMGATSLSAQSDLQLVMGQVVGNFQAKDPQLAKYLEKVLVLDNGTQFTSERVQNFYHKISIRMMFTSVEHPQSNGQAESANKVVLSGLRKRVKDSGL
ncbi:uncharacterized protein LOC109793304 [Cajanus cajan]|uniref:uncharacterized protein LOC109793304 n=1 Tax=Cajanus cajan TaxID=3821 RepID=UPI00098DD577|nr:uncharacterized protein LOC109793304 [Cajanus cajan]